VGFSRLEYVPPAGTGGGAPVWHVDLFDGSRNAGRMVIGADSGAVLDRDLRSAAPERDSRTTRRDGEGDRREYDEDLPPISSGRWSQRGEKFRSVEDFFHRLGKRFERRSDQLKKFFVGDEPR
jgi:hypothetical protein